MFSEGIKIDQWHEMGDVDFHSTFLSTHSF